SADMSLKMSSLVDDAKRLRKDMIRSNEELKSGRGEGKATSSLSKARDAIDGLVAKAVVGTSAAPPASAMLMEDDY
ncbi:MAG: hypothetical protein AAF449_14555, partial [Myxococcota bacterium]